ncbi:hypothetical protein [Maridesulfovibrio frigidus]|uniref:hypothetical protein n=1 Tax=Maridesulfovibrio frigidus TaxID=340956 RepID=UPI0004E11DE7|nr:hypothetical protein [Maridesulfovibrio frigidus]
MSGKRGGSFLRWLVVFVSVIIIAGVVGYFVLQDYSQQKVKEFTEKYSNAVEISFDRALVNPLNQNIMVWNVQLDFAVGGTCSAEFVVIKRFDDKHAIPHYFEGDVKGINVPVDFMNLGTLSRDFGKMGYNNLRFDLSADYIYEEAAKLISVRKLDFDGKDICKLNVGFNLSDVKLDSPGLSGLIGVKVLNGDFVLHDNSLISRMIEFSAFSAKMTSETYLEGVLENLQLKMQESRSLGNGHAEDFYGELIEFIANPDNIQVKVDPADPVSLLYLFMGNSFEELLSLYGVTAHAKPAQLN